MCFPRVWGSPGRLRFAGESKAKVLSGFVSRCSWFFHSVVEGFLMAVHGV